MPRQLLHRFNGFLPAFLDAFGNQLRDGCDGLP
jgi:hypothetical protein